MISRGRFLPRFSLRTLLLFVLSIASGFGLWWRWDPWHPMLRWHSDEPFVDIKLSPDGKRILVAYNEREGANRSRVALLNSSDFRIEGEITPTDESGEPIGIAYEHILFSPDSRFIVTLPESPDNIRLWSGRTGKRMGKLSEWRDAYHSDEIAFSNDNRLLASGSGWLLGTYTKGLDVWELPSGNRVNSMESEKSIAAVSLNSDGSLLLAVENATPPSLEIVGAVNVLDPETGSLAYRKVHGSLIVHASFMPNGKHVFSVTERELVIWEAETGKERNRANSETARYAWLSPDRSKALTLTETEGAKVDSDFILWDTEPLQPIIRLSGYGESPQAAFSPDGERFVLEGDPAIRSTKDGSRLWKFGTALAHFSGESFDPSGDRLLASRGNRELVILERRRPEHVLGALELPELWLTVVLGLGFCWSVWRDRTRLRRKADTP